MGGGEGGWGGEGMGVAIPTIERTPYMYLDLGYFITFTITQHNTITGHKYRAIIMSEGQASGEGQWQKVSGRRQTVESNRQKANGRR